MNTPAEQAIAEITEIVLQELKAAAELGSSDQVLVISYETSGSPLVSVLLLAGRRCPWDYVPSEFDEDPVGSSLMGVDAASRVSERLEPYQDEIPEMWNEIARQLRADPGLSFAKYLAIPLDPALGILKKALADAEIDAEL